MSNGPLVPDEELEIERVCNGRVIGGEAPPNAEVQEAGAGRKPRRRQRRSKDAGSSPEVALRSVSEMLGSLPKQAVNDLLDSGRPADQREPGSDVSGASEDVNRPVSFDSVSVIEVKFNDDGARIILGTFDVAKAAELHKLRHRWLRMDLTPD